MIRSILLVVLFILAITTPSYQLRAKKIDIAPKIMRQEVNQAANVTTVPFDYALMIDAGSSGSRIHIYIWNYNNSYTSRKQLPFIEEAPMNSSEPWGNSTIEPLASFYNNPSDAGESLASLIEYAASKIPESYHNSTPLWLKATAGMRLLPLSQQKAIIDDVDEYLSNSVNCPFAFKSAEVIPGQWEGTFGWLTVNFLAGKFGQHGNETYGALDLGGASTQVTFYTPEEVPESYSVIVSFANVTYQLYAYSYLGYGLNQANFSVLNSLVDGKSNATNITNPCVPSGYLGAYNNSWSLAGSSDYEGCVDLITSILNKSASCEASHNNCSFNGVYQPPPIFNGSVNLFYAFSAYYFLVDFFDLPANVSITELQNVTSNYCALTWDEMQEQYPGNSYAPTYCFLGSYATTLLTVGLNFPVTTPLTPHYLEFVGSIDNVQVVWAPGAVLYELSLLYVKEGKSFHAILIPGIVALCLLVVILIACGITIFKYNRASKASNLESSSLISRPQY